MLQFLAFGQCATIGSYPRVHRELSPAVGEWLPSNVHYGSLRFTIVKTSFRIAISDDGIPADW